MGSRIGIDASQTAGGRRTRRRGPVAVACALAAVLLVVALVNVLPGPVSASGHRSIGSGRPPTAVAPFGAVIPPAANPDPLSPGLPVGSDQYQSDPFLYRSRDRYFLYTSGVPGFPSVNVPVASATTIGTWTPSTDALPVLPPWAVPGFTWAPDIHQFGSSYVLYFTALVRGSSPPMQCIGAATGSSPDGTFTARSTPFICQTDQGGTIDPRVFTDNDGTNWMLFKSDQNIGGASTPTKMWSQPLTADGLGLVGRPFELMQPDQPWQGTIVEAPDMVVVGGTYWVIYSGNWYNRPDYAIGAARCAGPAGPCADTLPVPLLGTNTQGEGPGEASVYHDATGVWMLYSPWRSLAPLPDFPPRPVFVTRLGFAASGAYLAAGGPPPSLDVLNQAPEWSAP
jgi:Glycosyl hydrolases family 43